MTQLKQCLKKITLKNINRATLYILVFSLLYASFETKSILLAGFSAIIVFLNAIYDAIEEAIKCIKKDGIRVEMRIRNRY